MDEKNIKAHYIIGVSRCELGKILPDRLTDGIENLKKGMSEFNLIIFIL